MIIRKNSLKQLTAGLHDTEVDLELLKHYLWNEKRNV